MTEKSQRSGQRQTCISRQFLQPPPVGEQVALPAQHSLHQVTSPEPGVAGLFDDADRDASHHFADGDRRNVAGLIRSPPPVGGIEGKVDNPDQQLAVSEYRHRLFVKRKIGLFDQSLGASRQAPLSIGCGCHGFA